MNTTLLIINKHNFISFIGKKMSMSYIKKSTIFYNPELTSEAIKIQETLNRHKIKFKIINRSSSKPKENRVEKMSLGQVITL
jgi:transketolase C-terminal domain/subunit